MQVFGERGRNSGVGRVERPKRKRKKKEERGGSGRYMRGPEERCVAKRGRERRKEARGYNPRHGKHTRRTCNLASNRANTANLDSSGAVLRWPGVGVSCTGTG